MRLQWVKEYGMPVSWSLYSERDLIGYCAHLPRGDWKAYAKFGDERLTHICASSKAARSALEREIDKRSIGLLGSDVVTFWSHEP